MRSQWIWIRTMSPICFAHFNWVEKTRPTQTHLNSGFLVVSNFPSKVQQESCFLGLQTKDSSQYPNLSETLHLAGNFVFNSVSLFWLPCPIELISYELDFLRPGLTYFTCLLKARVVVGSRCMYFQAELGKNYHGSFAIVDKRSTVLGQLWVPLEP